MSVVVVFLCIVTLYLYVCQKSVYRLLLILRHVMHNKIQGNFTLGFLYIISEQVMSISELIRKLFKLKPTKDTKKNLAT